MTENQGLWDFWIVKLNNIGDIEWQKSYGGSSTDEAYSIHQTTDGGYIVAGTSTSNNGDVTENHGYSDFWIIKLFDNGDMEWQKSYGGSEFDIARSIQQTTDGGYIVAGESSSTDGDATENQGLSDFWVIKLNSTGNMEWQKSYGGSGMDEAYSIQHTTDGGYLVAGRSHSNDGNVTGHHGERDVWIIKLDGTGNIEWQKSLGGSDDDGAYSVQQTTDGGYIIAGYSSSNDGDVTENNGQYDFWIVKLVGDGTSTNNILAKPGFSIFPNPTSDILTITGFNPEIKLIITNVNGQTVLKKSVKDYKETIDISGLPAGVYFINGIKFIKK